MNTHVFRKFTPSHILLYLILILWSLTTVFPFAWVLVNSFKNKDIIQTNAFFLHFEATLENYQKAQSVGRAYVNSLFISGLVMAAVRDTGGGEPDVPCVLHYHSGV